MPERPRRSKPTAVEKAAVTTRLLAKGVSLRKAQELAGEGEDLTREQIAARRIAWQKTLPKAT